MADNDSSFSHIVVSDEDDDEVVIHAGQGGRSAKSPVPSGDGMHVEDETEEAPDAPESDEPPAPEESEPSAAVGNMGGEPMPLMQKVIIAAAIVFVIGFCVYYAVAF